MTGLGAEAQPLLDEIAGVIAGVPAESLDRMVDAIAAARVVAVYGQGRAGLVMQALAMRVHHLGLDAHMVGAMNARPLGPGDLFLVNAANGDLPTGLALIESARRAGSSVGLFTAAPESPAAQSADCVVPIPARMQPGVATARALLMGSAYELTLLFATELLARRLMGRLGVSESEMWARHANLL